MAKPKLSDEVIIEIQDLWDSGVSNPDIAKRLDKSTGTIDKYVKQRRLRVQKGLPLKPQQEVKSQVKETEKHPIYARAIDEPRQVNLYPARDAVLPTYPEVLDPKVWLDNFLKTYGTRTSFIKLQIDRMARRNDELPHPQDLRNDVQRMESGHKNRLTIDYIIEEYQYQLDAYLKKLNEQGAYRKRNQGIPTNPSYGGQNYGYPTNMYNQPHDGMGYPPQFQQPAQPQQYPPSQSDNRMARIEDELRHNEERERQRQQQQIDELRNQLHSGGQPDPQILALQQELKVLSEERRRDTEDKLRGMEAKLATGVGLSPGDVQRMIESERSKLTNQDIMNIVNDAMSKQTQVSELDIKSQEAKDKFSIEKMKLEEKGKTRDTIANAVKTGFGQIGAAVARTAHEVGSEETVPMTGVTDNRHMWQSDCPFCGTSITAPLDAKLIICPGCGKKLEVSSQEGEAQIQTEPNQNASFTVKEQEPIHEHPIPQDIQLTEPRTTEERANPRTTEERVNLTPTRPQIPDNFNEAECPFCKNMIAIPPNAKMIECPICKHKLEVGATEPARQDIHEGEYPPEAEMPLDENQQLETQGTYKYLPPDVTSDFTPEEEGIIDGAAGESEEKIEKTAPSTDIVDKPEVPKEVLEASPETTTESFVCPECGKIYDNPNSLRGHMLHHYKEHKKEKKNKKKGK